MRRVGMAFAALSVLALAMFAAGTLALNAARCGRASAARRRG